MRSTSVQQRVLCRLIDLDRLKEQRLDRRQGLD